MLRSRVVVSPMLEIGIATSVAYKKVSEQWLQSLHPRTQHIKTYANLPVKPTKWLKTVNKSMQKTHKPMQREILTKE